MSDKPMLKPFPDFQSDEEAEEFVATADLSQYDFSQFKPMRFEFGQKAAQLNLEMPQDLIDAVKLKAEAKGVPLSRYVRLLMEQDVLQP